jgi:hypothetical protein
MAGPGVVLMHVIPGLTPEMLRLGTLIYTRWILRGSTEPAQNGWKAQTQILGTDQLSHMCGSGEFAVFSRNRSNPVVG